MSEVTGAAADPDLSVAYRALERRREEVVVQRDRIAAELKKLDAALEALRGLADNSQESAAANGQEVAPPAAEATEATEATKAGRKAAPEAAAPATRSADRKTRVIEFLLENPRQWFTSSQIATLTEEGKLSGSQRNAVSETLRRLLRRKAVQRDDSTTPVRYRAVPSALRELLLSAR
jgi:hypothetical protein